MISTPGDEVPRGGVRITHFFDQPLRSGAVATLVYFDPSLRTWRAVPSTLSTDRRQVTAVVHHLSVWSFVSGVLSTTAKPPSCNPPRPSWVDTTTFIATDDHNPILFCTGSDPKNPDLLVIKAAVNRGYGFHFHVKSTPSWTYNTTGDEKSFNRSVDDAVHVDKDFHDAMEQLFGGGDFVGPGEQYEVGLDESAVLAKGEPRQPIVVLKVETPTVPQFLAGVLGALVGTDTENRVDGYVAAGLLLTQCVGDTSVAQDAANVTRAAARCVSGLDETAARTLATFLARSGKVAHPGQVAGKIVGRASIYLALLGPALDVGSYIADANSADSTRSVTTFVKPVTKLTLRTAEMPAECQMPAQLLVQGHTTKGAPGEGWIMPESPVAYGDLLRRHYDQALATYTCTAGGVSWPANLVLIGEHGKLLANASLGDISHSEHADPSKITIKDHQATVSWAQYEGAGFEVIRHQSVVTYVDGKLHLDDRIIGYDPDAVIWEMIRAAGDRRRGELRDPHGLTDAAWANLLTAGADGVINGDCSVHGSVSVCSDIEFGPDYARSWKARLEKASNIYGWRLVSFNSN